MSSLLLLAIYFSVSLEFVENIFKGQKKKKNVQHNLSSDCKESITPLVEKRRNESLLIPTVLILRADACKSIRIDI